MRDGWTTTGRRFRSAVRVIEFVVCVVCAGCSEPEVPAPPTTFAAFGHTLGFHALSTNLYPRLAARINAEEPKYVFALGDLTLMARYPQYRAVQEGFLDLLDAPYFIAAGNHDLQVEVRGAKGRSAHLRRVGYFYRHIEAEYAHFVVVNSVDAHAKLRRETNDLLDEIDPADRRPRILMTHHKLWLWPEMASFIDGRFDAVVAGDATPFYREHELGRSFSAYSAGMGFSRKDRIQPVFFVVGTIGADRVLSMRPVVLDIPPEHRWWGDPQAAPR